jgi:tetratricopeptide (TPR) repeat protein
MSKMTSPRVLISAVAVVALSTAVASAQYRIDNSNARDASNRLGSGGFNTDYQQKQNGLAGNFIVTGNVTGGQQFRGAIGYVDQRSFRGSLGSSTFDSFVRQSSGFSAAGQPQFYSSGSATPFFGASTVGAPPAGFQRTLSGSLVRSANSTVSPIDNRIDYGGAFNSDLAGIATSRVNVAGSGTVPLQGRVGAASDQLRNLMRDEFGQTMILSEYTALTKPSARNMLPRQVTTAGLRDASNVNALNQQMGALATEQPEGSGVSRPGETGQGSTLNKLRPTRTPVNKQMEELRKRFDQFDEAGKLPGSEAAERIRQINKEIVEQRDRDRAAGAKKATDAAMKAASDQNPMTPRVSIGPKTDAAARQAERIVVQPDQLPTPGIEAPSGESSTTDGLNFDRPMPVMISSFSTGIDDEQIVVRVEQAQKLIQAGKFSSAVDEFEVALAGAPSDPILFMGRTIAELGGGYYRRAELHLRQGFDAEKALMMTQYDLRSMLREDRIEFLIKDLKQNAVDNPKDPGPLLLLAFIDHNTGNAVRAIARLDEAQARVEGKDELITQLKQTWSGSIPGSEGGK